MAKNTLFGKIWQFVDKKRPNVDYVFLSRKTAVTLHQKLGGEPIKKSPTGKGENNLSLSVKNHPADITGNSMK